MYTCASTASQEKSHFRNWSSKRYLSPALEIHNTTTWKGVERKGANRGILEMSRDWKTTKGIAHKYRILIMAGKLASHGAMG